MTFSLKCTLKVNKNIYLSYNTYLFTENLFQSNNKNVLNLYSREQGKGLIEFLSKRSILRLFQLFISQNGVVNIEALAKWLTRDFKALTSALKNMENLESKNSIE